MNYKMEKKQTKYSWYHKLLGGLMGITFFAFVIYLLGLLIKGIGGFF